MKKLLTSQLSLFYPETLIFLVFILLHLFPIPGRYYLTILIALALLLYKFSKNVTQSLWLTFIFSWLMLKGRYFQSEIVAPYDWDGNKVLNLELTFLFSDAVLALVVYYLITRKRLTEIKITNINLHRALISLLIFMVFTYFSVLQSVYFEVSFYYYLQLIKMVFIFLVSIYCLRDKTVLKKTLEIIGVYTLMNALLVLVQFIKGSPLGILLEDNVYQYGVFASESPNLYRPGGFSSDPNIAATYFAIALPVFITLTIINKSKKNIYGWVGILIILSALIVTASRTAWFITLALSFLVVFLQNKKGKIFIPQYFIKNLKLIVLILFFIFSPVFLNRLESLKPLLGFDRGLIYRLNHIGIGFNYFLSSPFGIGLGATPFAMAKDFPPSIYGLIPNMIHNLPAQILGETGISGIILFIIFIILVFRLKLKNLSTNYDPLTFGLFLSFVSCLFMFMFFPWFLHPRTSGLLWILSGLGLLSKSESRVYS